MAVSTLGEHAHSESLDTFTIKPIERCDGLSIYDNCCHIVYVGSGAPSVIDLAGAAVDITVDRFLELREESERYHQLKDAAELENVAVERQLKSSNPDPYNDLPH